MNLTNKTVCFCSYSIGENAYSEVLDICEKYGTRVVIIGGKTGIAVAMKFLEKEIENSKLKVVETILYGTECTYSRIDAIVECIQNSNIDMIFGIGGGKALDTAKGVANKLGIPVFTFPTIAATCAATTALSVVYNDDGSFAELYQYKKPAEHCFINLRVIASAPYKYLQAGMGDTLAKYFEAHFSSRGDILLHSSALGVQISNMCYFPLLDYGVEALENCKNGCCTQALSEAVLANIVSTGLVSLLVDDEYNCAVAHSIYYGLACIEEVAENNLHGNIVAYGVLVQLAIDEKIDEAIKLREFLQKLEIPTKLSQMNVKLDRDSLDSILENTIKNPAMEHIPYKITVDMLYNGMEIVENF